MNLTHTRAYRLYNSNYKKFKTKRNYQGGGGVVRSQGSGCFEKDREGSDQEHLSCMFTVWTECLCSPKFMFSSVQCLCVKIYVLKP